MGDSGGWGWLLGLVVIGLLFLWWTSSSEVENYEEMYYESQRCVSEMRDSLDEAMDRLDGARNVMDYMDDTYESLYYGSREAYEYLDVDAYGLDPYCD